MNGELRWSYLSCKRCSSVESTVIRAFRFDQDGHLWLTWFCASCDDWNEPSFETQEALYPLDKVIADITEAREAADEALSELPEDFKRWEVIFGLEEDGDA